MPAAPLPRRLFAEFLGSAFPAAAVIGSGIAAAQLSPNDVGLQLLENAAATATGLFAFILTFGPVSGTHFNPVVSLVDASFGGASKAADQQGQSDEPPIGYLNRRKQFAGSMPEVGFEPTSP
jgi:hypothetical protein